MTAYLMVLPGLILIFTAYVKGKVLWPILKVYTAILLVVTAFLVIADLELYRNWGFRMDTTPLMYMKSPKEAIISTNIPVTICLLLFWILFCWTGLKIHAKIFKNHITGIEKNSWAGSLVLFVLTACLFIPIRGGFTVATMNTGSVYFHKTNVFANHAAINVIWNIGNALASSDDIKSYPFFDARRAQEIFNNNSFDNGKTIKLLNNARPNIIVIIMESFTSKIIEPLNGVKGVTPNFTKLCHEGILFDQCFASGDRTDKGVISVLSGYPALPRFSIINFSRKTEKLPFLNQDLKQLGYSSEFVYGCDIDFANFRSYFHNAKYDKIISRDDFDPSQCNSKWGAHDHFAFNRLYSECNAASGKPFFKVFLSLSSHEPFDVPIKTVIPGNDEEHRYLNSAYYADSSLGDFIKKAKTADWWKNTLVVIVADHGSRHPGNTPSYVPLKFHIPLLWLGGVINKQDTVIHTFCSQTDIPKTLLRQLDLDDKELIFSKDIMSSSAPAFGFYVFNDGFGYLKKEGKVAFDNSAGKVIFREGNIPQHFLDEGKAQMQILSSDFSKR